VEVETAMGLDLIVQYFGDERDGRRAEYDFCVRRNLAHPYVDTVYSLGVEGLPPPDDIAGHPKFQPRPLSRRLRFRDAFEFANANLGGRMVGICNLDIFLDSATSDWAAAEALIRSAPIVLCQSRIEFDPPDRTHLDPAFLRLAFAAAQDAWFFVPPLSVENIDFELGTLGCDNALADRIKRAGGIPVNMASRFRVCHYDVFRGKTGATTNAVHEREAGRRGRPASTFPEREGCYLLPDIDMLPSIDAVVKALGLSPLRRYQLICDILSQEIKIKN
jgi:hypothetical protein